MTIECSKFKLHHFCCTQPKWPSCWFAPYLCVQRLISVKTRKTALGGNELSTVPALINIPLLFTATQPFNITPPEHVRRRPAMTEYDVVSTRLGRNFHEVMLYLPSLSPGESSRYQQWRIRWRQIGSLPWKKGSTLIDATVFYFPKKLADGRYEVQARAFGQNGKTPFSNSVRFSLSSTPGIRLWVISTLLPFWLTVSFPFCLIVTSGNTQGSVHKFITGFEEEKNCFRTSDKDGKLGLLRDVSPSQGLLQSAIRSNVSSCVSTIPVSRLCLMFYNWFPNAIVQY